MVYSYGPFGGMVSFDVVGQFQISLMMSSFASVFIFFRRLPVLEVKRFPDAPCGKIPYDEFVLDVPNGLQGIPRTDCILVSS